ncbi:putative membrane protein [Tistlia consotensis]|uniref:Putative membrane protein n=1 Tax=Tistlia consotensis USBA 355 TaxID=560819 RepID=A0A1Y6BL54_9PROT|nr:SHOCT domain-containing protein [Tistlia consotensis]SMF16028.1 putative membrane protein [Tistlia consotensis USBA 355]SNR41501.1 putative membrane protein [Tistlia consotensis]
MKTRRLRYGLAAVASAAASGLPAAAWAQQGPYYYGHMWNGGMGGDGWHGWFLGPIMMILVLVLVVVGVAVLLRWLVGPAHPHHPPYPPHYASGGKSALDILKERFARGEIDKEEFEERRRVLGD